MGLNSEGLNKRMRNGPGPTEKVGGLGLNSGAILKAFENLTIGASFGQDDMSSLCEDNGCLLRKVVDKEKEILAQSKLVEQGRRQNLGQRMLVFPTCENGFLM